MGASILPAGLSSSDVIALSSAVIALCAFFATIWQGWLAHRHNRLSVRPLLVWHTARRNGSVSAGIRFSVRNLGLGPAVIRDRWFTRDGSRFHPVGLATDEVQDFAQHVFGSKLEYRLQQFGLPGRTAAIAPGAEVVLADLEFPSLPGVQLPVAMEVAGVLQFHLEYSCHYGKRFKLVGGDDS